ncbi:MAG: ribonuclease E/G, partial [Proteobacteria bacterium]|nr:ribonuclease E/G [Pseudomonadota bacterium]
VADVVNDELVKRSRLALEGSSEDLSLEEIEKRTRWVRIPIEQALISKQNILVQVVKDPFNAKGARLSMMLTLPGRYLVVSPSFSHIGISKKIAGPVERERLRTIVARLKPASLSVIVRTAAEGVSEEDLREDLKGLVDLWGRIEESLNGVEAPSKLHFDINLVERVLRDHFSQDVTKIVVD